MINFFSSSSGTGKVTPLFDYYTSVGNVGTSETDLYSSTIAAGQLATNGDKLEFTYGGTLVSGPTSKVATVYFAGSSICLGPAMPNSASWGVTGTIIRVSATVVRFCTIVTSNGASPDAFTYTNELTGLTLSSTNILKVTATVGPGGSDNDMVATLGTVNWISHA
jgi:hypothetical protein